MNNEVLEKLVKSLEKGDLSPSEELFLLKEINFSYDVLNKFLEELRAQQIESELK